MPIAFSGPGSTPAGVNATGTILPWTQAAAPTNYLLCDGSAVSRTTYAALFTAISTTFGSGDGSTTFNVPDLRLRTIHGFKTGDANHGTIGGTGGVSTRTLTATEIPAHTHDLPGSATAGGGSAMVTSTDSGGNGNRTTSSYGSGSAFNTLTPYMTMNWIIKT